MKNINYDKLGLEDTMRLIGELNASHNHIVASLTAVNDPELKEKLEFADEVIVQLRRKHSNILKKACDLDEKLYCIVCKHIPTAITLAGEIGESAELLYAIMASLTNGKIEPCVDCSKDSSQDVDVNSPRVKNE